MVQAYFIIPNNHDHDYIDLEPSQTSTFILRKWAVNSFSQKVLSLIFEWNLNMHLLMVHINFYVNDEFHRKNPPCYGYLSSVVIYHLVLTNLLSRKYFNIVFVLFCFVKSIVILPVGLKSYQTNSTFRFVSNSPDWNNRLKNIVVHTSALKWCHILGFSRSKVSLRIFNYFASFVVLEITIS